MTSIFSKTEETKVTRVAFKQNANGDFLQVDTQKENLSAWDVLAILYRTAQTEKYELCKIGLELGYLSLEDLTYIAEPTTTTFAAERRLRTRRLAS